MDKRPESGFTFDAFISTSNGSATQPGDYTRVDVTVTFSRNDFSRVTINGQPRYRAAKQVPVTIQDDTADEGEEDFTVTIQYANPGPPHLQGGAATMRVTITDNDFVAVTLSWEQPDVSVDEDALTVTLQARATTTSDKMPESGFTVALSATTAGNTATQGSDYRRLNSSFSFSQGDFTRTNVGGRFRFQATRDISVSIINDTVDEPDEDFTVILNYSDPSLPHLQGGPSRAVVTIQDNEHVPVTLSWEQAAITVGEHVGSAALRAYAITTVDKRPESGFTFDASISTSNGSAAQPGDYTRVDDTVTFSRNDFSRVTINGQPRYRAAKQVPVTIQDDTADEGEEDFTVTIEYANPGPPHLQGGAATMRVTITDNDFVPVTLSWEQASVSVDEDAGTVTLQARATTTSDKMPESGFTVALSATTAGNTATQGSDYRRLNSSFSFSQGDFTRTNVGGRFRFQATRDISVSIINDTVDEPDEDFTVILNYSGPSLPHLQGGPSRAVVTIQDNEHVPVTLSWEQAAITVAEHVGTAHCTPTPSPLRTSGLKTGSPSTPPSLPRTAARPSPATIRRYRHVPPSNRATRDFNVAIIETQRSNRTKPSTPGLLTPGLTHSREASSQSSSDSQLGTLGTTENKRHITAARRPRLPPTVDKRPESGSPSTPSSLPRTAARPSPATIRRWTLPSRSAGTTSAG